MTSDALRVTTHQLDGTVLLALAGEVDLVGAGIFLHAVRDVAAPGRRLVISLEDVTFLDGRGLSALVEAGWEAVRRGGTAVVVGARDMVRRTIEMTELSYLLAEAEQGEPGRSS